MTLEDWAHYEHFWQGAYLDAYITTHHPEQRYRAWYGDIA